MTRADSVFGVASTDRRAVLRRAANIHTPHFGIRYFPNMHVYSGVQGHSLSGARIFGLVYGRRARVLTARPSLHSYKYQAAHRSWWAAQVWRRGLYSSIPRPEARALAASYALMSRRRVNIRSKRYSIANRNRVPFNVGQTKQFSKDSTVAKASMFDFDYEIKKFGTPFGGRVHTELARMQTLAVRKQRMNPTLTPTLRRYLERMWRIRFRLRFEKFFFKRTGCRTYVWLQSTFRGLRMSYRRRFRHVVRYNMHKNVRKLAGFWRWSTFQQAVFYYSLFMMVTLPGNLEMPFITLARLLKAHRSHFAVIRFFTTYLKKAMNARNVMSLFSFRMRIAGKFVGELKRRTCIVGVGEMRLARYQIPADFFTRTFNTRYGIFGMKFWIQIFPYTQWFERIIEPTSSVHEDDQIKEDDISFPGWLVFEQDELVGQWFFREAHNEYRFVEDFDTLTPLYSKRIQDLGTENRPADFKMTENSAMADTDLFRAKTYQI